MARSLSPLSTCLLGGEGEAIIIHTPTL